MSQTASAPALDPRDNTTALTLTTKQRSLWGDAMRRLVRNRLSIIGLTITGLLLFTALFGPAVSPYSYTDQDLSHVAQLPTRAHWLGTDEIGRDLFSRVLYGARTATLVAVFSTAISVL